MVKCDISYTLRPAFSSMRGMNDSFNIFDLRNQLYVRKICFNSDKIEFYNHSFWYRDNYKKISIIESNKVFLGYIRLDRDNFVNIAILKKFQSKGLASDILSKMDNGFAVVFDDNLASIKAFMRAGFKPVGKLYKK